MSVTKEQKLALFQQHAGSDKNTGSAEAQVALFTARILHLTDHLKKNKKDFVTQRSLIILVSKRRKMLNYLKKINLERYKTLIANLGLRK